MASALRSLVKARSLPLARVGIRNYRSHEQDLISYPRYPMKMSLKVLLFLPLGVFIWYPMVWFSVNIRNFQHAEGKWSWTGAWYEETKDNYREQMMKFGKEPDI